MPHDENFDFKLTSDAKISQLLQAKKYSSFWLFSNFYALIGHNLIGEFMQKIYAASWNLLVELALAEQDS